MKGMSSGAAALAIAVACALACGENTAAPAVPDPVDAGTDGSTTDTGDAGGVDGAADATDADGATMDAAMDAQTDAAPDAGTEDAAGNQGPDASPDAADDAATDATFATDAQLDADADPYKVVFVTSTLYQASFGGLEGADAVCQSHAAAVDLPGTFRAWLSTRDVTAAERLTHAAVPYVRTDGTTIADDWDDLVDGTLAAPIISSRRASG
jgi:hypothetical protein